MQINPITFVFLQLMHSDYFGRYKNITSTKFSVTILEIGCGNGLLVYYHLYCIFTNLVRVGHALMELQAYIPYGSTFCVNKDGYKYVQAKSQKDMCLIAFQYKIPIYCINKSSEKNTSLDSIGRVPLIPQVTLIPGIQFAKLPYKSDSIDFIMSQHALNEGKILSTGTYSLFIEQLTHFFVLVGKIESHEVKVIIPRIATLLRIGGYAAVSLLVRKVILTFRY